MKKYAAKNPKDPGHALGGWNSKVYQFVRAAGENGVNRHEVATGLTFNVGRVSSILAILKREGYIIRLGDPVDPTTLSPEDAMLHALSALENAIILRAQKNGVTPEMEKSFALYQKTKGIYIGRRDANSSVALKSAMDNEAAIALRTALNKILAILF